MNTNDVSRGSRGVVVLLAVMLGAIVLAAGYAVVMAAAWAGLLEALAVVVAVAVAVVAGLVLRARARS